MSLRIGFIGAGAVATALSQALARAGRPPVAVASRRFEQAVALATRLPGCVALEWAQDVVDASDLVFLTVPDDAIRGICAELRWGAAKSAIHCSGVRSLESLDAARRQGACVGSFHPLQAFTGGGADVDLIAGSTFGVEAEPPLRDWLVELATAIGGRPLLLTAEAKPLYHAAAVIAANFAVTLMAVASDLYRAFGIERDDAVRALLPLVRGAVDNVDRRGLPSALTGPIVRGDVETVALHLAALRQAAPEIVPLYQALAEQTVRLARERDDVPAPALDAIDQLVSRAGHAL